MNLKQSQISDFIHNSTKLHINVKSGTTKKQSTPFHLFLSGSRGCDKSHLIQIIFHRVSKVFLYRSGDPTKPRVLLLAPTGVAAININSNTIHPRLHLPFLGKLFPFNDANNAKLRNKYSDVELVIIDEISMVSTKLFYQVHKCIYEIFCPGQDIPFGGKSVLFCGDLYQLPPVRFKPVFTFNKTETMEGFISSDLWQKFRLAELDQVICQDNEMFINLFNKIRVGQIDQNIKHVIKSRLIDKDDTSYTGKYLHIFAENSSVKRHNENRLKYIPGKLITIPAKDEISKNSKISDVREAQYRTTTETGGLASILELKSNFRVMLTTNINIKDQLINGQMGTVTHIEIRDNEVQTIYLELDDKCAGQMRMSGSDINAKNTKWVPIKRDKTSIYLNKYKTPSPANKRTQIPVVLS